MPAADDARPWGRFPTTRWTLILAARPDVNAATAKAINRAMETEPEDRPASAAGYIQAIAKAAGL